MNTKTGHIVVGETAIHAARAAGEPLVEPVEHIDPRAAQRQQLAQVMAEVGAKTRDIEGKRAQLKCLSGGSRRRMR